MILICAMMSSLALQASWRWKMVGVSQSAICYDYGDPEGVNGD